jgi:hypothetical protein
MTDKITELNFGLEDINSFEPYPDNPRKANLEKLEESLKENGQYRPIVVNAKNKQILAGNHTWKAMKNIGEKQIYVTYVDADEATAKKIVLVDNRLNDLATYDTEVMSNLLGELMNSGELVGTGFTADDVDDLLAEVGDVSVTDFEEFEGGYAMTDDEIAEAQEKKLQPRKDNKVAEPLNDVLLYLKDEDYKEFKEKVNALSETIGKNITETVVEAVKYMHMEVIEKRSGETWLPSWARKKDS